MARTAALPKDNVRARAKFKEVRGRLFIFGALQSQRMVSVELIEVLGSVTPSGCIGYSAASG